VILDAEYRMEVEKMLAQTTDPVVKLKVINCNEADPLPPHPAPPTLGFDRPSRNLDGGGGILNDFLTFL